jgi:hypothetical protein
LSEVRQQMTTSRLSARVSDGVVGFANRARAPSFRPPDAIVITLC